MLTQNANDTEKELRLSMDRIIDLVRGVRNGLITDFLIDANLKAYFREHYSKELSKVKSEFLKRDLKDLLKSPVDLSHYGMLIKQMQEHNSAALAATHQTLFYQELKGIFKKYNY